MPADLAGDPGREAQLHQPGAVCAAQALHPHHLALTQGLPERIHHPHHPAGLQGQGIFSQFIGDRHQRHGCILAGVHQGDGQPRADRHALLAAGACFTQAFAQEVRHGADILLVDVDQLLRADRRARVAGDLLGAVQHREDALLCNKVLHQTRSCRAAI